MSELAESALQESDHDAVVRALTPPADQAHVGVQDAARRLKTERTLAVVAALGSAPALLAHALVGLGEPHVFYVAADAEAAT